MSSHNRPGSNMAPTSWKALTSSRLTSFKDYVGQMDYKATYESVSSRVRGSKEDGSRQSWDQWAKQALRRPYGSSTDLQRVDIGVEKVQLFPGWAVRRYKDPSRMNERGAEFGLDVYVSGFASSVRPLEAATRSQRAFYRLAKGYAALPKLPTVSATLGTSSQGKPRGSQIFDPPADVDVIGFPSTTAENTEQTELEALDAQFRDMSTYPSSASLSYASSDDVSHPTSENAPDVLRQDEVLNQYTNAKSDAYNFSHTDPIPSRSDPPTPTSPATPTLLPPPDSRQAQMVDYAVRRLHANLDSRLQPFWSSALPNRMIRLSIFCPHPDRGPSDAQDMKDGSDTDFEPLATKYVTTSPQGAFQTTFNIPWDQLATHPPTLHIPFGEQDIEYPVVVQAEVCARPPHSPSPSPSPHSSPALNSLHQRDNASRSHLLSESSLPSTSASSPQLLSAAPVPAVQNHITISLPTAHVPVRLISDIDDTIKHAGVLQGAKHVFRNVFVRHLEELVVHSMVDWYKSLWEKGVRFHYVSNSPFELLPVLTEYFQVSSLPEGSLKLKSYAARSLLPALLSSPATRKRQGVVEVLDAFPDSYFILVGDTGEQDMELYAELARERPHQIVGIFVRNVSTAPGHDVASMQSRIGQLHSAAGDRVLSPRLGGSLVDTEPEPIKSMPSVDSLSNSSSWPASGSDSGILPHRSYSAHSPVSPSPPKLPRIFPRSKSWGALTMEERKQYDLETRIRRAEAEIPQHIAFRVFREPDECVEAQNILEKFLGAKQ
ncbi:hypothetical protein JB92DRAFT_2885742 [Gautieria morchelliformis]|nr:hypothetical protein JB92DRAFT_2885742 [Gautieria morchelliformis]